MAVFKAGIIILSLHIFLSSSFLLSHANLSPVGTIERAARQQVVLASLPPSDEPAPTSGSSQLFLTSPSGKYSALLVRQETAIGAGGFANDLCYLQVEKGGKRVWESECVSVSNVNTCSLVFSDAGLEVYDGSTSAWETDHHHHADVENLQRLDLLDEDGEIQIRDEYGQLKWKASEIKPKDNQNCGSSGGTGNGMVYNQQQQGLVNQPPSPNYPNFNLPFSNPFNQPFGINNQQGLVDNTPFLDSGVPVPGKFTFNVGASMVSLFTFMAAFGIFGL